MTRNENIVARYNEGIPQHIVGKEFGVCQATVSGILRRAGVCSPKPSHRANQVVEPSETELETYHIHHRGVARLVKDSALPLSKMKLIAYPRKLNRSIV